MVLNWFLLKLSYMFPDPFKKEGCWCWAMASLFYKLTQLAWCRGILKGYFTALTRQWAGYERNGSSWDSTANFKVRGHHWITSLEVG